MKTILKKFLAAAFIAGTDVCVLAGYGSLPPSDLTCDLLEHTDLVLSNCYPSRLNLSDCIRDSIHLQVPVINSSAPMLGWMVNDSRNSVLQTAYQVQMATTLEKLTEGKPDVWDSGEVTGDNSTAVKFGGSPLAPSSIFFWRVRTWNNGNPAPFSSVQTFLTGTNPLACGISRYPLQMTDETPKSASQVSDQITFYDFGRAAFGRLHLTVSCSLPTSLIVRLGEVAHQARVEANPGGSRRFREFHLPVEPGTNQYTVLIPPDERNTGKAAVKVPAYAGEVMPFRYCEIEQDKVPIKITGVLRESLHYPFNDEAADFHSSDRVLDDIWELCKYSIKATSFTGIYIDGDRERIPYEADALINQKCHYAVDREYSLARNTEEWLIHHPNWPTEWPMQSVLLAWNDYLYTGNLEFARQHYGALKSKTLMALAGDDGLISSRSGKQTEIFLASIHLKSTKLRDIVDWPQSGAAGLGKAEAGETDGFVFTNVNTVVNAYHYRALTLMSQLAAALGETADAESLSQQSKKVKASFNRQLFDAGRGVYVDGVGVAHASLHANFFPLTFGLVPPERRASVLQFVKSRGMGCSVYGAQHLLDGLYQAGAAEDALRLLTNPGLRGWAHMIYDVGTTITLEAWDDQFKPNEDWNHAWGAAPANLIPFQLMGVHPVEPGWKEFEVKPQPANLKFANLSLPTIRGTIQVALTNEPGRQLTILLKSPANTVANLSLPLSGIEPQVKLDGKIQALEVQDGFVLVPRVGSGTHLVSLSFRQALRDNPVASRSYEPASN